MPWRIVLRAFVVVVIVIATITYALSSSEAWTSVITSGVVIATVTLVIIARLLSRLLHEMRQLSLANREFTSAFNQFRGSLGDIIRFNNEVVQDIHERTEGEVARTFLEEGRSE
jgi:predicted ferric reductase